MTLAESLAGWKETIADVVMATGWTWEQCLDELTADRLEALQEHWRHHPPVHKMVAAFVGYEPPPTKQEREAHMIRTPEDARRYMAVTGGKIA